VVAQKAVVDAARVVEDVKVVVAVLEALGGGCVADPDLGDVRVPAVSVSVLCWVSGSCWPVCG